MRGVFILHLIGTGIGMLVFLGDGVVHRFAKKNGASLKKQTTTWDMDATPEAEIYTRCNAVAETTIAGTTPEGNRRQTNAMASILQESLSPATFRFSLYKYIKKKKHNLRKA